MVDFDIGGVELILSRLVDTFISRISLSMPPIPKSRHRKSSPQTSLL